MKSSQFRDTFAGSAVDPSRWTVSGDPEVADGRVRLTNDAIESKKSFDFANSQVAVEVVPESVNEYTNIILSVEAADGSALTMQLLGTQLQLTKTHPNMGSHQVSVQYDAAKHLWWRIREVAGVAFWETSPNGLPPWNTERQADHKMDLHNVHILFADTSNDVGFGFGEGPFGEGPFGGSVY